MLQSMRQFLQISALLLASLGLGALVATADVTPHDLAVTCGDTNATAQPYDSGHCTEGMVTFRGSDFPETVYVKVLSYPAGRVIDRGGYTTQGGLLTFTQTLVPAGGYTVKVAQDEEFEDVYTNITVYTDSLSH